jgi:hypothetical protein
LINFFPRAGDSIGQFLTQATQTDVPTMMLVWGPEDGVEGIVWEEDGVAGEKGGKRMGLEGAHSQGR